jgi:hypothetical protein
MDRGSEAAGSPGRAHTGQKVLIVLDHIKGDRREEVERFYDLFWHSPGVGPPEDQATHDNTRLLYPSEANDDGTYTYAWIFDPFLEGADYNIPSLLRKMYGAEKADEYFRLWADAHVSDPAIYTLVQM